VSAGALEARSRAWAADGLCRSCGADVVEGRKFCETHLLYQRTRQREIRAARRASGVCVRCTSPAIPGQRECERHRQVHRKARARMESKARAKERDRRYYANHKDQSRVWHARHVARRIAAGLCVKCGWKQPPERVGKWWCRDCVANNIETRQDQRLERISAGLCTCGRPPREGMAQCERCATAKVQSVRAIRDHRRANGLCLDCGGTPAPGRKRCAPDLAKRSAREGRRQRVAQGRVVKGGR
jgi:hypothetical protein